jgi:hypothetical protein
MRKFALLVVACCAALPAAPAGAQVPPRADYGGGDVTDASPGRDFNGRAGDNAVSLRVGENGTTVQVAIVALHTCGRQGVFEVLAGEVTTVAPDGAFTLTTVRTIPRSNRDEERVTVAGKIQGPRAVGTFTTLTTDRRGKRLCRGSGTWAAIQPPALPADAAPPPAGAVLRGPMPVSGLLPFSVALRVSPDGKRVRRFNASVPWRCKAPRTSTTSYYTRSTTIRPDGSFTYDQPFRVTFTDAVERGRIRITGRFVNGGAVGTLEMTATARRKSGKLIERCRSGKRTWAAAP